MCRFPFCQIFEFLSWQNESSSVFILALENNFLRFYKKLSFYQLCIGSLSILNLSSQMFTKYFQFYISFVNILHNFRRTTRWTLEWQWQMGQRLVYHFVEWLIMIILVSYENCIRKSLNTLKNIKPCNLDYGYARMQCSGSMGVYRGNEINYFLKSFLWLEIIDSL